VKKLAWIWYVVVGLVALIGGMFVGRKFGSKIPVISGIKEG